MSLKVLFYPGLKNKNKTKQKIISIDYLVIVLIKIKLLISLVFSKYGLVGKC